MSPRFFIFWSREVNPDFTSKVIMKKLGTDYSHVGIIKLDPWQEHWRFGTIFHNYDADGFSSMHVSDFLKDHLIYDAVEVTEHLFRPDFAEGWLNGNIGRGYAYLQLLGFLWDGLRRLVANGRRKSICSEDVGYFFRDCSVLSYFDGRNLDFISPKLVVDFVKTLKK